MRTDALWVAIDVRVDPVPPKKMAAASTPESSRAESVGLNGLLASNRYSDTGSLCENITEMIFQPPSVRTRCIISRPRFASLPSSKKE